MQAQVSYDVVMVTPAKDARARVDKRRVILDAAGPIFAQLGYERASVDAIADSAQVSKPTVYAHFGNKEQLFRDTMADIAETLNDESRRTLDNTPIGDDDWESNLRTVAYGLTSCERSGCAAALQRLVVAESHRDPLVYEAVEHAGYEPIRTRLAARLEALAASGGLDIAQPAQAARFLTALTRAAMQDLGATEREQVTDTRARHAIDAAVDVFLRAYRVDPSARRSD